MLRFAVMEPTERDALELALRRSFEAGDLRATADAAIRSYGPELYRFLVGLARDAETGGELFAGACEKVWRGLPGFRWNSSCRVWMYAIARNHFFHWTRDRVRQRRAGALSEAPVAALVQEIRTTTAAHLRTEVKEGFARLRATLEPDDQLLLHLRVEAGMAWNDIATVLAADAAPPSARDVAALRKRYERLKRELQVLAREQQLVE